MHTFVHFYMHILQQLGRHPPFPPEIGDAFVWTRPTGSLDDQGFPLMAARLKRGKASHCCFWGHTQLNDNESIYGTPNHPNSLVNGVQTNTMV